MEDTVKIKINNNLSKKEEYYIIAIKNLLKKINTFELLMQLNDNLISEKEYLNEINNHQEKYIISLRKSIGKRDLVIIAEIAKKLDLEFTIDEVGEMFSIDPLFCKLI